MIIIWRSVVCDDVVTKLLFDLEVKEERVAQERSTEAGTRKVPQCHRTRVSYIKHWDPVRRFPQHVAVRDIGAPLQGETMVSLDAIAWATFGTIAMLNGVFLGWDGWVNITFGIGAQDGAAASVRKGLTAEANLQCLALFVLVVALGRKSLDEALARRPAGQPSHVFRFVRSTPRSTVMAVVNVVSAFLLLALVVRWVTTTTHPTGPESSAWCTQYLGVEARGHSCTCTNGGAGTQPGGQPTPPPPPSRPNQYGAPHWGHTERQQSWSHMYNEEFQPWMERPIQQPWSWSSSGAWSSITGLVSGVVFIWDLVWGLIGKVGYIMMLSTSIVVLSGELGVIWHAVASYVPAPFVIAAPVAVSLVLGSVAAAAGCYTLLSFVLGFSAFWCSTWTALVLMIVLFLMVFGMVLLERCAQLGMVLLAMFAQASLFMGMGIAFNIWLVWAKIISPIWSATTWVFSLPWSVTAWILSVPRSALAWMRRRLYAIFFGRPAQKIVGRQHDAAPAAPADADAAAGVGLLLLPPSGGQPAAAGTEHQPQAPQPQDQPQAAELQEQPGVTEQPEVLEPKEQPEAPELHNQPEVPELHKQPEAPQPPVHPEAPEVPELHEQPGVAEQPEVLEPREQPEAPEPHEQPKSLEPQEQPGVAQLQQQEAVQEHEAKQQLDHDAHNLPSSGHGRGQDGTKAAAVAPAEGSSTPSSSLPGEHAASGAAPDTPRPGSSSNTPLDPPRDPHMSARHATSTPGTAVHQSPLDSDPIDSTRRQIVDEVVCEMHPHAHPSQDSSAALSSADEYALEIDVDDALEQVLGDVVGEVRPGVQPSTFAPLPHRTLNHRPRDQSSAAESGPPVSPDTTMSAAIMVLFVLARASMQSSPQVSAAQPTESETVTEVDEIASWEDAVAEAVTAEGGEDANTTEVDSPASLDAASGDAGVTEEAISSGATSGDAEEAELNGHFSTADATLDAEVLQKFDASVADSPAGIEAADDVADREGCFTTEDADGSCEVSEGADVSGAEEALSTGDEIIEDASAAAEPAAVSSSTGDAAVVSTAGSTATADVPVSAVSAQGGTIYDAPHQDPQGASPNQSTYPHQGISPFPGTYHPPGTYRPQGTHHPLGVYHPLGAYSPRGTFTPHSGHQQVPAMPKSLADFHAEVTTDREWSISAATVRNSPEAVMRHGGDDTSMPARMHSSAGLSSSRQAQPAGSPSSGQDPKRKRKTLLARVKSVRKVLRRAATLLHIRPRASDGRAAKPALGGSSGPINHPKAQADVPMVADATHNAIGALPASSFAPSPENGASIGSRVICIS